MTRNIGIPRRPPIRRPFLPYPSYWSAAALVLACLLPFALAAAFLLVAVVGASPAEAQWRGHHRGQHHGGWQRQERRGGEDSFVGGIVGGMIGGMIANRPVYGPPPYHDPVAECVRRFRSYSPELGIYYGYDGRPRRCP